MDLAPALKLSAMSPSMPNKPEKLLSLLLLAVLSLACATPLALNLADPDLWGHVLYGREWIADGELPRTATHTYTADGYRWINHENLAELALAHGFENLGIRGMLIAKCLLGLTLLGLIANSAFRNKASWIIVSAITLLVAKNLEAFFPLRPQLLSFLCCALLLWLVDRGLPDRATNSKSLDWRWLLPLPLLMIVWINSHGGVLAGMAILTALLLGKAALECFAAKNWNNGLGLIGLLAVCYGSLMVNPYGSELILWFAESLGTSRPEITEWGPPLPGNPVFIPFVLLCSLAAVSLAFTEKKRDWIRIAILLLVGWQAAKHLRHIAFFALLCGFWLPVHMQSVFERIKQAIPTKPSLELGWPLRSSIALLLLITIGIQSITLGRRLSDLPVYRSNYPVDAIRWMHDREMTGKLVVCFNWAQYAIAALEPRMAVSFDGRFRTCYPQEIVDMNFDFLMGELVPRTRSASSGPIDATKVLNHGAPDYVLVDRRYLNAAQVMQDIKATGGDEWSLVYQDAVAQLWGRALLVDQLDSIQYVAESDRLISNHYSMTSVSWPALPGSHDWIGDQADPVINKQTNNKQLAKQTKNKNPQSDG